MVSHTPPYDDHHNQRPLHIPGWRVLWILWQIVRLPVLAVVLALEPFVSLVLTATGLLGIVMAVTLKFSGDLPQFPFWEMLALSISAFLALMIYRVLVGILAR